MRELLLVALLVAVSVSGCLGGPGVALVGVFADWELPEGDPTPVPALDCPALHAQLTARALAQADALLQLSVEGRGIGPPMMMEGDVMMAAPAMNMAMDDSASRAEVTGTNNQEGGVDEADVLKTDGEWTYVVRGTTVFILRSDRVGDLEEFARFELDPNSFNGALLLEPRDPDDALDDRLVVISESWRLENGGSDPQRGVALSVWEPLQSVTRIQVFDLVDRARPHLAKELVADGSNVGARLVDGHAYIVVQAGPTDLRLQTWLEPTEQDLAIFGLTWDEFYSPESFGRSLVLATAAARAREANRQLLEHATLADHLPTLLEPGPDGQPRPVPYDDAACGRVLLTKASTGRAVSTIFALRVDGDDVEARTLQVLGSSPTVYGAQDALVLASSSRDAWWFWDQPQVEEATDLHWFDLDGLDVRHRASGRTAGTILDSFSIDVHDETLRVATTTGQWGRWWVDEPAPMMNHLVVFEEIAGALVPVGLVGGIAPDERIWSARFTDDRAYIVTFEQTDPLWIVDLSDTHAPTILGELEIPGVSTYIHPLSDDLLLTIGLGPGRNGQGLDWGRLQVSLFDIRDPAAPRRADVMDIAPKNGASWSAALDEHKAFTYWDRIGLLAVPVSTTPDVWDESYGGDRPHVGLRLIRVDEAEQALTLHGEVDQDDLVEDGSPYGYWGQEIQRSYFLGFPGTDDVSVYALSSFGMTAHDVATLDLQASVAFA